MATVVVIAVVAFLRHEMGKRRPDEPESAEDNPAKAQISDDQPDSQATGTGPSRSSGES
jgi:hypothetical protein